MSGVDKKTKLTKIEQGVYLQKARIINNLGKSGDITIYRLREMSDKQIKKYDLQKYVRR